MWRPSLLVREAYRNLGARHTVLAVALSATLIVAGVLTSLQAASALRQQDAHGERGAAVWWVQAGDKEPVPARLCAVLNGRPGVVGAGALGREQMQWYPFEGARGVTADIATPGIWVAWAAPQLEGRTVAGADAVDLGFVSPGGVFIDEAGHIHRIEASTPPSVQPDRLRANVVATRFPDFAMSECWVRMEEGSVAAGRDLIAFAFSGHEIEITPFVADDSIRLSPLEQWRGFAGLFPGAVAGALVGLLVWLSLWSRRTELAVYRTFGTTRGEVAFLVAIELGFVMAPAALIGMAAGLATVAFALQQETLPAVGIVEALAASARVVGSATLIGGALGTVSVLAVVRGGLHDHLKDR